MRFLCRIGRLRPWLHSAYADKLHWYHGVLSFDYLGTGVLIVSFMMEIVMHVLP